MLPVKKCPACNLRYVTSKARYFFKKEGLQGEPICLYCLAEKTGKAIGSLGLLEDGPSSQTPAAVDTAQMRKSVQGCRPCAQRRRLF